MKFTRAGQYTMRRHASGQADPTQFAHPNGTNRTAFGVITAQRFGADQIAACFFSFILKH